jgi:hypothetical protein
VLLQAIISEYYFLENYSNHALHGVALVADLFKSGKVWGQGSTVCLNTQILACTKTGRCSAAISNGMVTVLMPCSREDSGNYAG